MRRRRYAEACVRGARFAAMAMPHHGSIGLLIGRHDVGDGAFQLLRRRALPHHIAECRVARHLGIAPAPGHAALGIEPDHALGALGDAAQDIGTRIEVVASRIAEDNHRGLRRYRTHPLLLEIGERIAVVGRAETDTGHDVLHGGHRVPLFQHLADLDEVAGKGERAHIRHHLVQAVDQQQEEIRHLGHRARDIADRHDLGPVTPTAFPGGEEGNAAPGDVAADRAANVEMTAALALARLAVALAQPARDLADQCAHLLDLPWLQLIEWRVAQDLVAQLFLFFAPVQQQRLGDAIANIVAQRLHRLCQPLGLGGIAHRQRIEIVAQTLDAELIEDLVGINPALGEIADLGQVGRIRRAGQRRRHRGAVVRQQHLRQRAEAARRIAAGSLALLRLVRRGQLAFGFVPSLILVVQFGRRSVQIGMIEEQVEAVAQRLLLLLGLGQRQQEGVAQHALVGEADLGHRPHRIDAFGGRDPHPGPAGRPKETMQVLLHRVRLSSVSRTRADARPWQ